MRRIGCISKWKVLCLLLLVWSVAAAAQTQPQFLQTLPFPGSASVVADFNGDGILDTASFGSGDVLFGNGDGTFRSGPSVSFPGPLIATADFNGDGKADLLTGGPQSSTTYAVLLGNGDGTFQPAITTNPGTTFLSVVVADVNGDGKPDILGLSQAGTLFVLLGNGDGTFKPASMFAAVSGGAQIGTGDFNGDGKLDVVIFINGGLSPGVVSMLGNGDGTFKPPVGGSSTGVFQLQSFSIGDINGDGKLDLVVADSGFVTTFKTFTLLGNGDGTFQAPVLAEPSSGQIALADFNNDGKLDLVISNNLVNQIFLGNGDGTFGSERDYANNLNSLTVSGSIVVADFNNDHKLDIATTNGSLLLGNGNGTFQSAPAVSVGGSGPIAIGDFSGDGLPDIAGVFSGTSVSVLLNQGNGKFTLGSSYSTTGFSGSLQIVTADFNGDGKLDLAIAGSGSSNNTWTLNVLLGNGDGTFGSPLVVAEGSGNPLQMVVADFNGDGKADLGVMDSSTSSLLVLLGNGDGTFSSPVGYFASSGAMFLATADFNGDGHVDVAASGGANIAILLGKGDGTFAPATFISAVSGPVSAGDLNGDGKPDLVASLPFQVFLGKGDGTFAPLSPNISISPFSTILADLNGDGILDVVAYASYNNTGTQIALLLGNGDGTFGPPSTLSNSDAHEFGYDFLAVADLNADKRPDIVLSFSQSGGDLALEATTAVLLNTTPATAPSMILTIAKGSSNTATVTAGAAASYDLTIRGLSGFSGTASLTCTGAPTGAACSVPASINVSATSNVPFTVTVATTARTTAMLGPGRSGPPSWLWAISIFAIVCLPMARGRNRLGLPLRSAFSVVLILFFCSCGGSSSNNSGGTPVGTYTVTVTATSGSMTTSMPLTLNVIP
jgi:FG-GAP-like repeat